MFEIWAFLILCYLLLQLYWYQANIKYAWLRQFPGLSLTLPILGDAVAFVGHPSVIGDRLHVYFKKLGSTFKVWFLTVPSLATADPALVKILTSTKEHIEKHFIYDYAVKIVFGNFGLVTSSASQWLHDRKILNRIFNPQMFEKAFNMCVERHSILCKNISLHQNVPLDSTLIIRNHYFYLIINSLSTDPSLSSDDNIEQIDSCLESFLPLLRTRLNKPWTKYEFYWKLFGYQGQLDRTHELLQDSVKIKGTRSLSFAATRISPNEVLKFSFDTPMKSMPEILKNINIPSQWKYDNFMTFLGAGADTSFIATTMTLFYLALNPECQRRALEEVDSLFEIRGNEPLAFSDLSQMKYIKMCLKEAMRLHPPIPIFGRTTTHDVTLEDGRKIPNGTSITVVIKELHMNPEFFPNPEKFDPKRFSESNLQFIKPYTYIPFSMGPRNCIGQKFSEITLPPTIAYILRNFSVSTQQKPQDIKMFCEVSGTPFPSVEINYKPRDLLF